jgi:hypothetical protein
MVTGIRVSAAQVDPVVASIIRGGIAPPWDDVIGGELAQLLAVVEVEGFLSGFSVVERRGLIG